MQHISPDWTGKDLEREERLERTADGFGQPRGLDNRLGISTADDPLQPSRTLRISLRGLQISRLSHAGILVITFSLAAMKAASLGFVDSLPIPVSVRLDW